MVISFLISVSDEVTDPLSQQYESARLDHESSRYEKHFETWKPIPTVHGHSRKNSARLLRQSLIWHRCASRSKGCFGEPCNRKEKMLFLLPNRRDIVSYCAKAILRQLELRKQSCIVSLWPREVDKTPDGFKTRTGIRGGLDVDYHWWHGL